MDLTKEYQNMLEAAQEIQDLWKWQIGDYYYSTILKETHVAKGNNLLGMWDTEHENGMWLPRQDQLQNMLEDTFSNREIVPLTSKLHDVCIHLIQKHNFNGRTMEKLWLAFLMHEKFNKVWIKNEWIEQ